LSNVILAFSVNDWEMITILYMTHTTKILAMTKNCIKERAKSKSNEAILRTGRIRLPCRHVSLAVRLIREPPETLEEPLMVLPQEVPPEEPPEEPPRQPTELVERPLVVPPQEVPQEEPPEEP
jgi:hypothetical protein